MKEKRNTRLQTHFERLLANNAPVSAYEQGMILLSAIPDEWDRVAAFRCHLLAEFNRSGGSHNDQTHVTEKMTAIKRKGKLPHFSKQKGANNNSPANNEAGPSSSKRQRDCKSHGKKPQGYSHHHSHFASLAVEGPAAAQWQAADICPMIALQPSWAGPSTMTIVLFKPQGISYESKPLRQSAQTFTGQTVRGPLVRSYLRMLSYSIFISTLRLYSRRISYFPHYSIPSP